LSFSLFVSRLLASQRRKPPRSAGKRAALTNELSGETGDSEFGGDLRVSPAASAVAGFSLGAPAELLAERFAGRRASDLSDWRSLQFPFPSGGWKRFSMELENQRPALVT